MNFGQGLYTWLLGNAQPLVLVGLLILGVFFAIKREFTKAIGSLIALIIAIGFVYDTAGVKDLLLSLFKKVFNA